MNKAAEMTFILMHIFGNKGSLSNLSLGELKTEEPILYKIELSDLSHCLST